MVIKPKTESARIDRVAIKESAMAQSSLFPASKAIKNAASSGRRTK
jgi:hypothetical protein